ncbi:MAG: 3-oxoacyl-ACP reductase FabG [Kiritimatiellia bacterium]|nr:3-oxoacyl-ACP reductase FabG [Kiritimatiellia bacterium]
MQETSPEKRLLITGASRGIGRAIALKAAEQRYRLLLHARSDRAGLQTLADDCRKLGAEAACTLFDIADRDATRQTLEREIEQNGPFYGIVCNAGIADDTPFPAMEDTQWDRVLKTDLDGLYNTLRPCILPMISTRKPGRIVTISSISGLAGNRGQVNYSAAKAGIIGATKALALELARRHITVNCVAPGIIQTDMTANLPADELARHIPMRRFGTPQEVAALVCFLLSDEASYITRQCISVNGGLL